LSFIYVGANVRQQYGMDLAYSGGNGVDHRFANGFNSPYDGGSRAGGYNQHARYGLGVGGHANSGRVSGGSMNGSIHGPKHKRGDMDRECELCYPSFHRRTELMDSFRQSLRW